MTSVLYLRNFLRLAVKNEVLGKNTVLIPFAGSGTECAMSAKENRNFIGFEIDAKHFKTATDRTEIIKSQPSLFF